ncbi:MAG: DUF11 domain-containing protein, partial [Promicromonosporaceae bacterium]|nr:DUF11 domain-containing protein [Promicromonosporaceae bacterium]
MDDKFVLVRKDKQHRRRGLLAALLTATLVTTLLGGTAHATPAGGGGDSYGSELDRSDLEFLSDAAEGGAAPDDFPAAESVETTGGPDAAAGLAAVGEPAETSGGGGDDVPDYEFFWEIGPDGVAREVDADGNPVEFVFDVPGMDAAPRGPTATFVDEEDGDWGAWDDYEQAFVGIDFGEDVAAFAAAIDPFNTCSAPLLARPNWNNVTTNSPQPHNNNFGGGVTSSMQPFYAYVDACHQLDIRFLTNQWRMAHDNGIQRAVMMVTSPTGHTTQTVLNRGLAPGQRGTGAMAATNGTTNPLERLQLRSATAGVWHIQVVQQNAAGNAVSRSNQGQGWNPHRFDISVRTPAGAIQRGRVWTSTLRQTTASHPNAPGVSAAHSTMMARRWNQRHWAMTSEGLRFEITQRSFNGIHSAMRVNGLGVHLNCNAVFRSMLAHHDDPRQNPGGRRYSVLGVRENCAGAPEGRIFWEPPDTSMPRTARWFDSRSGAHTWVNPQFSNPSITVRYEHTATGANYGGRIVVTTNQAGPITVSIAGQNRTFPPLLNARAGTHNITWDGRNGAGALVPLTTAITINASFEGGRTHFVHQDVEYREGGVEIRPLNGPRSGDRRISWGEPHHSSHCWINGTQAVCRGLMPIPMWGNNINSAVSGTVGAHRWGRTNMNTPVYGVTGVTTWGDGRQMNEWVPGSAANASVTLTPRGSCTMTGTPRVIPAGQTVTHTVTVRNDGPVARPMTATVNLTNALQNGRTTVASGPTANRGTATRSGNTITWNGTLNA